MPITIREAKAFVRAHHRHAPTVTGARLAIALDHGGRIVGVALLGRPTSRELQEANPLLAEATRVAVLPDAPKGATSKLTSRLKRIWQLMGGTHFKTYNLASEGGESLRGAGATIEAKVKGRDWSCSSRPRADRAIEREDKQRWDFGVLPEIPA